MPDLTHTFTLFCHHGDFTLETYNHQKNWDGTIEWTDGVKEWSEWDGTTILRSKDTLLHLRGIGNHHLTYVGHSANTDARWVIKGKNVSIDGYVDWLLDYSVDIERNPPRMDTNCFAFLFLDCKNLLQSPSFINRPLTQYCYSSMFFGCINLEIAKPLPASQMAIGCYGGMYYGCTSLTDAPALPAESLNDVCYQSMFEGCTSLTRLPELPATNLPPQCYANMFKDCKALIVNTFEGQSEKTYQFRIPSIGTGTQEPDALDGMFDGTGGDIQAPSINTEYYVLIGQYPVEFITDRTQEDVDRWKRLRSLGMDMTEDEKTEWERGMKGAYKESDLNRISAIHNYLAQTLLDLGTITGYTILRTNWERGETPWYWNLRETLDGIKKLKQATQAGGKLPTSFDNLTYEDANNIEQVLYEIYSSITNNRGLRNAR